MLRIDDKDGMHREFVQHNSKDTKSLQ